MIGMECFHCGGTSVHWCGDFTFGEWGLEGEGVVHVCECPDCGAEIIYEVPDGGNDGEGGQ